MSFSSLEQQLDRLEYQFNAVSSALVDGNPDVVQASSALLQQLAVHLVQVVNEFGKNSIVPAPVVLRLRALADGLPLLRANLLRRSAYVERALQLVVPATQKTTYATGAGPYGGGVKQSGAFKVFSA